jgi:phage shock protein A
VILKIVKPGEDNIRKHRMPLRLAIAATMLLAACDSGRVAELEDENESLRDHVATLERQVSETRDAAEDVRTKAAAVQSASEDMQSQVGRFDGENWREVVPDVESASGEVDDTQTALESSVSDLDDTTGQ